MDKNMNGQNQEEVLKLENCAYSLKLSRVKEADFPYTGKAITCTSELVDFAKMLSSADNEHFVGVYLDNGNKIICIHNIEGVVNQAVVYPRDVLRRALLINASAMVLIHNHPSGNVSPSDADIKLTRTIQDCAKIPNILIHDHIIIGGGNEKVFSMRDEGILNSN